MLPVLATGQVAPSSHDPRHPEADFENWTLLTELTADDGSHHGLATVFFTGTVLGLRASGIYVVLSEETAGDSRTYQEIALPLVHRARHETDQLLEEYRGNRLEPAGGAGGDGAYEVRVRIDALELSLDLRPAGPAIDLGLQPVGGNKTEQVVIVPRGTASARIVREGDTLVAFGSGLLQHERFGVGWNINSDAAGVDLTIEFAGEGQEILLADIPYWFGRCKVMGTVGDRRVEGVGHVYIRSSSGTPPAGG